VSQIFQQTLILICYDIEIIISLIVAGYSQEGFLAVQNFISRAIIEYKLNKPLQNVTIQMQRFPHPEYIDDPLLVALQTFVSLIFMLSFVYTSISCVRMVTHEKENQLKVYAA
jgi:hypothetical protein